MRVVTAAVLIPLIYILVKYLPPAYFLVVVILIVLLGQYEFYRLYFKEFNRFVLIGMLSGLFLLMSFYGNSPFINKEVLLTCVIIIALTSFVFFKKNIEESLSGISVLVFGVLYVAWTLGHLVSLRSLLNGQNLIFFVLIVTWAVDTGAYYAGKLLGSHKLSPVISPGKTVEGAIGGVIAALGAALLARQFILPELTVNNTLLIGLITGIISQVGDLSESLLKRSAGVKDSGSIIPAHGGLLDRVDSLIFSIPVFYYYVSYFVPESTGTIILL